jgi:hypothetical protein
MTLHQYSHFRSLGNPTKLFPKLHEWESNGWELVSILPFTFFCTIGYTVIMKRAS